MFGIGFSELLLIAVAALVLIGPKDLPVVLRHASKFLSEFRALYRGLKYQMTELMDEVGLEDFRQELHQNMTTIIDLEGKPQQAYDVRELENLKASKPSPATPSDVHPDTISALKHD